MAPPPTFDEYLAAHYRPRVARGYANLAGKYLAAVGARAATTAAYAGVLAYVAGLRARGLHARSLLNHLAALKAYYAYLLAVGARADHPCRAMRLHDPVDYRIPVDELYVPERLEGFLASFPAGVPARHRRRGRVAITLLVYQGLRAAELVSLGVDDVDLIAGTVRVAAGGNTDARTLPLRASQVLLVDGYVREDRRAYAAGTPAGHPRSERLLLSRRGLPFPVGELNALINVGRTPAERLLPLLIRRSVIAHLLAAGHDVRVVQAFAGHRTASTTERYRAMPLDELATAITERHPWR